jgi:Flp pilus assembly protein TadG
VKAAITRTIQRRFRIPALWALMGDATASQIAEFAISLPVLVLFVVGIFDFSGALSLKQKLTDAVRDAARVAAADPANDLGSPSGIPASVSDAYQVVDNDLKAEKINDCGLSGATPTAAGGLSWQSTANTGCSGTLVLTINRGCVVANQTLGTTSTDVIDTCVTIKYPYQWRYFSVASLVGGTGSGPATISTTGTAFNEN